MKPSHSKYLKLLKNPRALSRARIRYENGALICGICTGLYVLTEIILVILSRIGGETHEVNLAMILAISLPAVALDLQAKNLQLAEYFQAGQGTDNS